MPGSGSMWRQCSLSWIILLYSRIIEFLDHTRYIGVRNASLHGVTTQAHSLLLGGRLPLTSTNSLTSCMTIILLLHFPYHITMFSSLQDYMSGVGRHNLLYFKVFPQAFAQENNNCVMGIEGQGTGGNLSSQLASPSGSQSHRHSVNVSPLKKCLASLLCKLSTAGTESQFLHISEGIAHGSSSFRQGIKSDSVSLTPKSKPSHCHSLHLGQNRRGGGSTGKASSQSPETQD